MEDPKVWKSSRSYMYHKLHLMNVCLGLIVSCPRCTFIAPYRVCVLVNYVFNAGRFYVDACSCRVTRAVFDTLQQFPSCLFKLLIKLLNFLSVIHQL